MSTLRHPCRTLAALAATIAVLAACTTAGGDGDSTDARSPAALAAQAFLTAWAEGRDADAAAATDAPQEAQPLLGEVRRDLRVQRVSPRLGAVGPGPDGRQLAAYDATLRLDGLGDWTYAGALPLVEVDAGGQRRWLVDWAPAALHPRLTPDTRLARARELLPRASILDRDGAPLTAQRPVVVVGIEPRRLTDPKRAYRALGRLDVDVKEIEARVKAARPDEFVTVIPLREEEFAEVEGTLRPVPGVIFRRTTRTLAPTASWGRAVLGAVRPATEETLAAAGPLAAASDEVGSGGLQQAAQRELAGDPAGEVRLVGRTGGDAASSGGSTRETLHRFPGRPGTPVRTTLSTAVQGAAESVLATTKGTAVIAAVQPSTGEVLAAANSASAGSYNKAFVGRYPPGSTFKVVTTAALLGSGLDPQRRVDCPETVVVDGKPFKNYDELGALGSVPFRTAFARSCNTAFISVAAPLPADALTASASALGLGGEWDAGVETFSASVPRDDAPVDRAAAAIGQGRVLASPLAMAVVAAAVQSGTPRPPVLLPRPSAAGTARALPPQQIAALRALMQETVTRGTAAALRGASGSGRPVIGAKSGTAEYGDERPPRAHAWMIGYRGDLAFAVLVEDGKSGSDTAGPLARDFLRALG